MSTPSPHNFRPLPGFVPAPALLARAAGAWRPPETVTVAEAAARHRILRKAGGYSGPWRNELTPFAVEIMNLATDRAVEQIAVVAPAQVVKTEIALNIIAHAVKYRPVDMLVIQPTQHLAREFVELRVNRMLELSPDLGAELVPGRSGDKVFSKSFRRGMRLMIGWAVAGELAGRPVCIVILDERDRMDNDLNGEGSPTDLGRNRVKTFGRNGKVMSLSSPSKVDGTGIVAEFLDGDQNLQFVPCPICGEPFAPGFDADRAETTKHLYIAPGASPDKARALAMLICPHCGGLIEETHKPALLATARWLPRGVTIDRMGMTHGDAPATRRRSFWISGFLSPFFSWGQMAERLVSAEQHLERTGDESRLRVVINTDFGFRYKPRSGGLAPIEAHELASRCGGYAMGTIPNGVRVLTAGVDLQGGAFDVLVEGWDEHYQSWVVDRFDIRQLEDGKTDVRPARHPEHWGVLIRRVIGATYPFADDPSRRLPVALTAIDSAGLPGVTDNAVAFYRQMRRREGRVILRSVMLTKGSSRPDAPALRPPVNLELGRRRGRDNGVKTNIPLYVIGVNELKSTLDNRLRRETPGPLYKHFPTGLPEDFFAELTAERRNARGLWTKENEHAANETLDLAVLCMVAAMRLKPHRVNWRHPPSWARPIGAGLASAPGSGEAHAPDRPAPAAKPPAPATARAGKGDDVIKQLAKARRVGGGW